MDLSEERVISSDQSVGLDFKELWIYRELFYFFTWRDIKVKYKQTALGIFWVVLQPVITVAIFSFFFGGALKVPSEGLPYPVFVFSGLLFWNFFSSSVNNAGNSMLNNVTIIKKIYFPRIIIPVSALLVSGVDFLIASVVFLIMLIYYQVPVDILQVTLCWPLAIVLLILGTLGISCWLAALNVKYRDFRYVIPFGLQVALFVSPVIYPTAIVKIPWLSYALALNPMHAVIALFRIPIIGSAGDTSLIAISILSSLFFLIWGIYYFKRTEVFFADIA